MNLRRGDGSRVLNAKTPSGPGFYFDRLPDGAMIGRFGALDELPVAHAVSTLKGFDATLAASDPAAAAEGFARVLGVSDAAWLEQAHGISTLVVETPGPAGSGDGLITASPGLALVGRSADCPLVLVGDRDGGPIGMFHAGWRGTVGGIAMEFVRSLVGRFDSNPASLVACICPSIGICCYEVGQDVQDAAVTALGPHAAQFFAYRGGSLHFDMQSCIRDQLLRVGLSGRDIHAAGICTICHEDLFCSYRRQGIRAGRFQAAIARGS